MNHMEEIFRSIYFLFHVLLGRRAAVFLASYNISVSVRDFALRFLHKYRGRILGQKWDKSLNSFPSCYSQSSLLTYCTPSPPLSKCGLNLVWNLNIVHGNLKSKSSQDYAQIFKDFLSAFWKKSIKLHVSSKNPFRTLCSDTNWQFWPWKDLQKFAYVPKKFFQKAA